MRCLLAIVGLLMAATAIAQFPPQPEGMTVKQIKKSPGISISYRKTHICETKAKGFAGYVHIPSPYLGELEDASDPYNASIFFWYFEARNHPHRAPTAIYLAGGPGESSIFGATQDGGPCTILPDSNSTQNNPYSWNQAANMLYIDQPVGVGFSYDVLVNSTIDLLFLGGAPTDTGIVAFDTYNGSVPEQNTTFRYGTFPSQDFSHTANGTAIAARTLWHFAQVWFTEFPEYKTRNKRISYWGNSYGGYWVPSAAAYTVQQNAKIKSGKLNGTILDVDAAGWTNGCVDVLYQVQYYPEMAYNNTYDLQIIPKDVYESAVNNYTMLGGCRDLILQCRELGYASDPTYLNSNATVNEVCEEAFAFCESNVVGAYDILSNRSDSDIAHFKPDGFPTLYTNGFMNQAWVQKELGVPVNFTATSLVVSNLYIYSTADAVRTEGMKNVEYLLDAGIRIAMIYGDRDYRCPWNGAEHLSLEANWTGADTFRNAGYQPIHTPGKQNISSTGVVRQHGNLSFSRIFQAGHDAVVYQPETVYQIFQRTLFNKDVSTGEHEIRGRNQNYITGGPVSSTCIRETLPLPPPVSCYLLSVASTCTIEQYEALLDGTAVIDSYTIVAPAGGSPGDIVPAGSS